MHRLQIKHLTTYQFAEAVTFSPHRLLLTPRESHFVHIESAEFIISPEYQLEWQRDVYDNALVNVRFTQPGNRLSIESRVILQHYDDQPLDFLVADYAVRYPFRYQANELLDLTPYLSILFEQDQPQLKTWLQQFWMTGQIVETYLLLEWINKAIATGFRYQQRETAGVQSPTETLSSGAGCCRDFATLFIEACHCLGLAARFVSGYQHSPTLPPEQGATHAWAEVYLPGAGWKGFDSTSGLLAGNSHIAVAVSRNPEAIPPISGAFQAASAHPPLMTVSVDVREIKP